VEAVVEAQETAIQRNLLAALERLLVVQQVVRATLLCQFQQRAQG
jgi:hypothetical protein